MAQVDSETSTAMLGESPSPLYIPTDVTPEELFQAIGRLRKEARDEIDRLIRFLDESDNHMAIEDCAIDDDPCDTDEFEIADGTTNRRSARTSCRVARSPIRCRSAVTDRSTAKA